MKDSLIYYSQFTHYFYGKDFNKSATPTNKAFHNCTHTNLTPLFDLLPCGTLGNTYYEEGIGRELMLIASYWSVKIRCLRMLSNSNENSLVWLNASKKKKG